MEDEQLVRAEKKTASSADMRELVAVVAMIVVAFSGIVYWLNLQITSAL